MPLALLMVVIPVIIMLLYFNLADTTLQTLGLSAQLASLFLIGSIVGSMLNIPITRRQIAFASPRMANMSPALRRLAAMVHYYPPATVTEVVAVNVGGAIIPIVFSSYLIYLNFGTQVVTLAIAATAIVAIVAKLLARPVPGLGITLPSFVPPLLAAVTALGLTFFFLPADMRTTAAPIAYICGSLGTLIGADLLNLPVVLRGGLLAAGPQRLWVWRRGAFPQAQPRILSIGGAGVFDGIFLTGIVAPFLVGLVH
jgi:uncharacterized membrane protein